MDAPESKQEQSFLPEVKRFISYYSICLHYQKNVSDDQKQMKTRLNGIYHHLLLNNNLASNTNTFKDQVLAFLQELQDILKNSNLICTLHKAAIKTLIKLFHYNQVISIIQESQSFNQVEFIKLAMETKFDSIDQVEEEQILLLIQKLLIKTQPALRQLGNDNHMVIVKYFGKFLKKNVCADYDQCTSTQFNEITKKNYHKVIHQLLLSGENKMNTDFELKLRVIESIIKQSKKYINEKKINNKILDYAIFMIKTLEDSLKKISRNPDDLKLVILKFRTEFIDVTCQGGESEDIMIRNQTQQLFTYLLQCILDHQIPLREEVELMLVKVVLKPAILLLKKQSASQTNPTNAQQLQQPEPNMVKSASTNSGGAHDNGQDSDYENDDFIQVSMIIGEKPVAESCMLEMSINYLLETILILKPHQIASLFLMFDCQPFAENVIMKIIIILFKYSQKIKDSYYIQIVQQILHKFQDYQNQVTNAAAISSKINGPSKINSINSFNSNPSLSSNAINMQLQSGPSRISYMREQKLQVKSLVKQFNIKYKIFLKKIDDMFAYVDDETPADVAAKILLFSREAQLDKIAEVIGGKDDQAKNILKCYLDKLDYSDNIIQECLRKFLQTFRLAGVDAQVIFRILELFSHKFHEKDPSQVFKTKNEAYEFAYLILVLQTFQHNPSIKNRTEIKAFVDSAKGICPLSMDEFPPNFVEDVFHSVSKNAFYTPNSRSLIDENYNPYSLNEIALKLNHDKSGNKCNDDNSSQTKGSEGEEDCEEQTAHEVTENEFINAADLAQKQLFQYGNETTVPLTLIHPAMKYLLNFVTHKFIRFSMTKQQSQIIINPQSQILNSPAQQEKDHQMKLHFDLLTTLCQLNKYFGSPEQVDKLFQVIYRVIVANNNVPKYRESLESLLWDSFDCVKRSFVLIPKLQMSIYLKNPILTKELEQALDGVESLLFNKEIHMKKHNAKNTLEFQQHKSKSFIDIFYNYFTEEAGEEDEESKKEGGSGKGSKNEKEVLDNIRKQFTKGCDKEEDYEENIEEQNEEDKIDKQWVKEQKRICELITMICSNVRDNLNQEEGLQCLAFIIHIMEKTTNIEIFEKLWVELHLLLGQSLKANTKQVEQSSFQIPQALHKEEQKSKAGGGEYEVISTDTSQDSMEQVFNDLDLYSTGIKEQCQTKMGLYEAINRHLIVSIHIQLSKKILIVKQGENHHIIRDIKRLINQVVDSYGEVQIIEELKGVEDSFLFRSLNFLLMPIINEDKACYLPLKSYQKSTKILRIMLILLHKSLSKKRDPELNIDMLIEQRFDLLQNQILFFHHVSKYLLDLNSQIPFDLINLCQDILVKITFPVHSKQVANPKLKESELVLIEKLLQIHDNIQTIFSRVKVINDESTFESWMNLLQTLQEKIILNPVLQLCSELQVKAFNAFKNSVLNQPFDVNLKNQNYVRKLFSDLLFWLTYDNLSNQQKKQKQTQDQKLQGGANKDNEEDEGDSSDDDDLFDSKMESYCCLCLNTLSDIFIYYISQLRLQKEGDLNGKEQIESQQKLIDEQQVIFTYLWLNYLKVILQYIEKSANREFATLNICVQDNLKRVINFLMEQEILMEDSQNVEQQKLWKTSWDIIGAFFKKLKSEVVPQAKKM